MSAPVGEVRFGRWWERQLRFTPQEVTLSTSLDGWPAFRWDYGTGRRETWREWARRLWSGAWWRVTRPLRRACYRWHKVRIVDAVVDDA